MWCADSHSRRYLAVNRGVKGSIADSGAIRSIRVPNVKIIGKCPGFPLHFGTRRPLRAHSAKNRYRFCHRRTCETTAPARPLEAGQAPADHRRLDDAAGFVVAPFAVDPT